MCLSPSPPFSVLRQAGQGLIKNIGTVFAEQPSFSREQDFVGDADSGLFAIGSARLQTEFS
jgi:hypothetical protein